MIPLLFVVLLLSTLSSINAVNLLSNPSFEQCFQSSINTKSPIDWLQSGSGSINQPTVLCSTDRARTGNYSAQFTPQSVTNILTNQSIYESHLMQNVTINQSMHELTLTYWIYLGAVPQGVLPQLNGSYTFVLRYVDASGHQSIITPQYVEGSCTDQSMHFYQYSATFTPINQSGQLSLSFIAYDPSIYIYMDDVSLMSSLIVGDPQFVGLRGQSYQVHGIDGEVYNLVTSTDQSINSKFVFLNQGECPVINQSIDTNCWTHPGSYLGSIGVQQYVNGSINQLEIISGSAVNGFASVRLNGVNMLIDQLIDDTDAFSVHLQTTHRIVVKTSQFIFTFTNSDRFINQHVTSRVPLSLLTTHGLFGQTHRRTTYNNRIKYIEGTVDDYRVEHRDLFGTGFTFNRFQH